MDILVPVLKYNNQEVTTNLIQGLCLVISKDENYAVQMTVKNVSIFLFVKEYLDKYFGAEHTKVDTFIELLYVLSAVQDDDTVEV